jgi:hypothetical protein
MADGDNNISDVVQSLPAMASGNDSKPAGTVVSSNGQRVTLGEEGHHNAAISSPEQGMKLVEE